MESARIRMPDLDPSGGILVIRRLTENKAVNQFGSWKFETRSAVIFRCVARILSALDDSAASAIQDSRLQVVARPHDAIWAYFPIYGRRRIVRQLPYSLGPDV